MAFDYTSRDFNTVKADLLARAERVVPDWTSRDQSDFGMVMVDLWAYGMDVLHYYVDRAAGEAFLPTATQRESVLALANLFDYTPRSRTSAQSVLTLANSGPTEVIIPRYTRFVARYDGKTYNAYSYSVSTINANTTGTVQLYEGTIVNDPAEVLTNSSTGDIGQRYTLSNRNVVRSSVVIRVYEDGLNPVLYRRVDRISTSAAGDRAYVVKTNADNSTDIVFGNSVAGFSPPAGSKIEAVYAFSSGSAGNLPANSVASFYSITPDFITIQSSTSFSGGTNEESIDILKATVPSVIASQNRAVTESDYRNLALQVDGISKASVAYTPNPAGGASAGNASVTIYAHPDRSDDYLTANSAEDQLDAGPPVIWGQTITAEQQQAVIDFIQPRAMLGVDVVCASEIVWTAIDIDITITVNPRAVAAWVKQSVEDALDSLFTFNAVSYNQTFSSSQIYRTVMGIDGVDYAVLSTFDETNDSPQVVEDTITVGQYALPKKGTISVTVLGGITSV
jgi:predicted phage baseplate assembly protein